MQRLEQAVPEATLEDVRLLVSELVTNSLRHAGEAGETTIGLRVAVKERTVRVEVTDAGPGFDAATQPPTLYQQSGWGLYLVDQVSDRWGVDRDDHTRVWFEIDLAA